MAAKSIGYGSVLVVTSTTGELNLAQVRNISGPNSEFDDVDTTCLDSSSNFRTYIPGLANPGEVTMDLAYSSTVTTHKRLAYYHGQRVLKTFTFYPNSTAGDADAFSAYVKSVSREVPAADLITCAVSLKVSGKPGYST